tara:strand:+ start:4328 stop:4507 length:180 start_codon:yes stop_codon:yes gene_type:complete
MSISTRKVTGTAALVSCSPNNRHVNHGARRLILKLSIRQIRRSAKLDIRLELDAISQEA